MSSLLVIAFFGIISLTAAANVSPGAQWEGKPWLGKWVSTDRHENWAAFANALGFQPTPREMIHQFWRVNDQYYHEVRVPAGNFHEHYKFSLGKKFDTVEDGQQTKARYAEDGDKLVRDITVGGQRRKVVSEVQGDELIHTYKVGDVEARRWFKKQPHN